MDDEPYVAVLRSGSALDGDRLRGAGRVEDHVAVSDSRRCALCRARGSEERESYEFAHELECHLTSGVSGERSESTARRG